MRALVTLAAVALLGCDPGAETDAGATDAGARVDGGGHDAGRPSDAGGPEDAGPWDGGPGDAGPSAPGIDDVVARLSAPGATDADRDEVLREVAWTAGWPLRDGSRWLFVTRWDGAPAGVSLVSDLNGWDPAAHPAARAGAFYWAVLEVDRYPAGAGYKWYGEPGIYRAPPEATAYAFDENGELGYVAPPQRLAYRERFVGLRSPELAPRTLRALLPAGFVPRSAEAARARVLLLHDGQNVFHPDAPYGGWRADEAVDVPAFDDVVVLAIDAGPDRLEAYTHAPDDLGAGPGGGRADAYLDLALTRALPFLRARYGLSPAPERLAVGGSSLGGLVTLYLAMSRPTALGCAIAMSPTLGWGAYAGAGDDALVRRWTAHGPVPIYLDSGGGGVCLDTDGDGVQEDSADRDNFCTTSQLRDRLASLGYAHGVDLFHWHEPGATHDEAAWAARLPRALDACAAAGWTR